MNFFQYLLAEWSKLKQHKWLLLTVIIVLFVPLVYAMIILSPKWGPYDNMDHLPVAVVNNDAGADSDGEYINVGDELVESLQENKTLGWDFVSDQEAKSGMDNQKYYMTIEVPEEFSAKAITVMDEEPVMPELHYTQNEGLHFMAAQVTENALETIRGQLSAQVTETYVEQVFSQLDDVADGFAEASDGSNQLDDGIGQLKDGSDEMLGSLNEKAPDISRLADGAEELEDGAQELNDTVVKKQPDIAELANGTVQLNDGTHELLSNLANKSDDITALRQGAEEVETGTQTLLSALNEKSDDIDELSSGAASLSDGAEKLETGAEAVAEGLNSAHQGSDDLKAGLTGQLTPGSNDLAEGVKEAQEGVNETIESIQTLQEALKLLAASEPALHDNQIYQMIMAQLEENLEEAPGKQEKFQELVEGANSIRDGLSEDSDFYQGLLSLDDGLGELVDGQSELKAGIVELAEGADQVADGNKTVAAGWHELEDNVAVLHDGTKQITHGNRTVENGWQELESGAKELSDGAAQIKEGNATVKTGWGDLVDGSGQLYDGAMQISEGNATVKTGWGDLTDGVTQLDDGLLEAKDGSVELAAGLEDGKEQTSDLDPKEANKTMFASPVQIDGEIINQFSFYRDANAPYTMTLALFAGVLALSFVIPFQKPPIMPANGWHWFAGKASFLGVLVVTQALVISLFALFFLKVEVHSGLSFVLFSVWVSLTWLMIVLLFIALAGNIGKFIALVFVVLQLSTTGSDLPVHMLPQGLQQLSVFLPFTYAIDGFKQIITLGGSANVWKDASVLAIFFLVSLVLSLIVYLIRHKYGKQMESEKESIEHNAM